MNINEQIVARNLTSEGLEAAINLLTGGERGGDKVEACSFTCWWEGGGSLPTADSFCAKLYCAGYNSDLFTNTT